MRNKLLPYLERYRKIQPEIMLVYRPTLKSSWADRCIYKGEGFNSKKLYNHRNILRNEVVIEFDENAPKKNKHYASVVASRLKKDGLKYITWKSGNKSIHLHLFIDIKDVKNLPLLKKVIMRHYCDNLIKPDLRLASDNHMIRAEFGIHEKTQKKKSLIKQCRGYTELQQLSNVIWEKYRQSFRTVLRRKLTIDVTEITEHPAYKFIITSEEFRAADDGRERALFMLIHTLKPKYKEKQNELIKFLQDWYKYSGGTQLSPSQIGNKVKYHWNKQYTFGLTYLMDLMDELGLSDKFKNRKVLK